MTADMSLRCVHIRSYRKSTDRGAGWGARGRGGAGEESMCYAVYADVPVDLSV